MKVFPHILAVMILAGGWFTYGYVTGPAGQYQKSIVLRTAPVQGAATQKAFLHKGFTLTPVASFQIEARVLGQKRYAFGTEAKLAPVDLALGWGAMSDVNVLKDLKITQSGRWYRYRYKEPPILPSEIVSHSGNMHLIPANDDVARTIRHARRGKIVRMKGHLVNVTGENGWRWNTSLSRTDTGHGSCEVVWVESIEVL